MKRLLVAVTLLLSGLAVAQEASPPEFTVQAAIRVTNCIGFEDLRLDAAVFCNASGFLETRAYGVFAQVSPKYGPAWENWQVRAYTPQVRWNAFGLQFQSQPGVTTGFELGAWFVRVEMDTLVSFRW